MKKRTHVIKHKGIVADARELGVSYHHLWMVLEGRRESKPLLKRYRELKEKQETEATK